MGWVLFLAFVSVPVAEIALFIEIGGWAGLWPTVGAIVVTAAAGAALVRRQGLKTLERVQSALAENRAPVAEAVEGVFLLVAGALLLTPGFMTDAAGFALLIPPLRTRLAAAMAKRFALRAQAHAGFGAGEFGGGFEAGFSAREVDGVVIVDDDAPGAPDGGTNKNPGKKPLAAPEK